MRYPNDEPIDADFEVLDSGPPRSRFRVHLDRLAFATVAAVLTCIFAAICAGAALGAAFLSAS
jgi:hypothetical protein